MRKAKKVKIGQPTEYYKQLLRDFMFKNEKRTARELRLIIALKNS